MLTFDNIHPDLRVVGELLDPGHDLLWRRRAHLYMVVPLTWTIPSGFLDRIMPAGYLGITDATLVRLPAEFQIRRGKLISEDRYKASRHVRWFQYRVEEEYWNNLYGKGIIVAMVTKNVNPEIRMTPPMSVPETEIRILVSKSLPHRLPNAEEQEETFMSQILRMGSFFTYETRFFPSEPDNLADCNEFLVQERIHDCDYYSSINDTFPVFFDFEPIRKRIQDIIANFANV